MPAWHWSRVDTTLSVLLVQMSLQQWKTAVYTPLSVFELTGSDFLNFFQFNGLRDCTMHQRIKFQRNYLEICIAELSFNIFQFSRPFFGERNRSLIFWDLRKRTISNFDRTDQSIDVLDFVWDFSCTSPFLNAGKLKGAAGRNLR